MDSEAIRFSEPWAATPIRVNCSTTAVVVLAPSGMSRLICRIEPPSLPTLTPVIAEVAESPDIRCWVWPAIAANAPSAPRVARPGVTASNIFCTEPEVTVSPRIEACRSEAEEFSWLAPETKPCGVER